MQNRKKSHSPAVSHGRTATGAAEMAGREILKLVSALGSEGAYGWMGEDHRGQRLFVTAARNGVAVCGASFSPALAAEVCSQGLAVWDTGAVSGRRRLVVTAAGLARKSRESAPDGVDPFLAQQTPLARVTIEAGQQAAHVVVDCAESPLAWLAKRKDRDGVALIDAAQFEAGERLRRDFTLAGLEPRVTADWSAVGSRGDYGSSGLAYSEIALAARQRIEAALEFVGGDFGGLLLDVCGFLKGLEIVESERRWPRRSAKLLLGIALRQLARHYGIAACAVGPRRSKGLRHWGAAGYRPSLTSDGAE